MYYLLPHTLPQLATHKVYTLATPVGQATMQSSREPGHGLPDPPEDIPLFVYIIKGFVLVFIWSSSPMLRGLLVGCLPFPFPLPGTPTPTSTIGPSVDSSEESSVGQETRSLQVFTEQEATTIINTRNIKYYKQCFILIMTLTSQATSSIHAGVTVLIITPIVPATCLPSCWSLLAYFLT